MTNAQYDSIMREYDAMRLSNARTHERRVAEVYEKCPEYREADAETGLEGLALVRRRLVDGDTAATGRGLANITGRKRELLRRAGFSPDYLDPVYTCPYCKDTGYVGGHKCSCLRKRETSLLYKQSNLEEFLETENFSKLSYSGYSGDDLRRFSAAVSAAERFVDRFGEEDAYENLLYSGETGTGKSFLSCCIAKALLDRSISVAYFSAPSLFEMLAASTFDRDSSIDRTQASTGLYEVELLIIDDLGTEITNLFVQTRLFTLINERALRRRPMIITTNYDLLQLQSIYTERIFSRLLGEFSIYSLTGTDRRAMGRS